MTTTSTKPLSPKQIIIDGHVMTIQYKRSKCGYANCPCRTDEDKLHGPYWRGYWRDEQGKLHSHYIGKVLPK